MRDANFEKDLNNRLEGYQSPMDLEAEWTDLNARRPKKRRRPFAWVWWVTGIFILGAVFWFAISNTTDTKSNNGKIIVNDKIAIDKSIDEEPILEEPVVEEPLVKKTAVEKSIANKSIANKSIADTKIVDTSLSKNQLVEKSENFLASKKPLPKRELQNLSLQNGNEKLLKYKLREDAFLPSSGSNTFAILKQKENPPKEIITSQSTPTLEDQTLGEISPLPLKLEVLKIPIAQPDMEFSIYKAPPFSLSKTSKWAIAVDGAYGKSFRSLKSIDSNMDSMLVMRRNDHETELDQWQATIQVRRVFKENWFAEFGLGYSQATDKFEDIQTINSDELFDDQLIILIYKADGTIEETYGPASLEVTTTVDGKYYQQHQNAYLKLATGRDFSINQHFGTTISAGINYSFWANKKGVVLAEASGVYENLGDSNYKKTGLISGVLNVAMYYRTEKDWELSMGLIGQGNLNNGYKKTSDISEKRYMIGLQMGLRKWL